MVVGTRREIALLAIIGLVIGAAIGLYISWGLWPLEYYDSDPSQLKRSYVPDYVLLIAQRYAVDGDMDAAQERLKSLGLESSGTAVADITDQFIRAGRDVRDIRALAGLAYALGSATSRMAIYLAPTATATPAPSHTPTPLTPPTTIPTAVLTFTPTSMPMTAQLQPAKPSITPSPSPTPVPTYLLTERRRTCEEEAGKGEIRITVLDAAGFGVPGIALEVIWDSGEETIVTGLKPEKGPGYADFTMQDSTATYTVQIAGGLERVAGLLGDPREAGCPAGSRSLSWQLTFAENRG